MAESVDAIRADVSDLSDDVAGNAEAISELSEVVS